MASTSGAFPPALPSSITPQADPALDVGTDGDQGEGDVEDEEQIGLLGYSRILERKPSSIERWLGVVGFSCLCLAAIGFGLFAGELSRHAPSRSGDGHPVKVITTTIYLSPTNAPSPPGNSRNICSSGPCVDVSGQLRQIIQWGVQPCQDFAEFTNARRRPEASQEISSSIDQTITQILLLPHSNPILSKIQDYNALCLRKGINTPYQDFSSILGDISNLFRSESPSQADRFGSVLAYLHSASLPALFKTTISNDHFILQPQITPANGIQDAFTAIYPSDQALKRIQGVKLLISRLETLRNGSHSAEIISIEDLQDLSCARSWLPCWIRWKDYYSALNPRKPIRQLDVRGIEYFAQLSRIIAEHENLFFESYFHWVAIATIRNKDCQKELKINFGPSLLKHVFLSSQEQLREWKHKIQSVQFIVRSLFDLSPDLELPGIINIPTINSNQNEELSSIKNDDWVRTSFDLARIKTRKEFATGQSYWNELGTNLNAVRGQLYVPFGTLQAPFLYSFFTDLPKSLLFGSFGFNLINNLSKSNSNSSWSFEDTCQSSLSKAFQIWKKYENSNRVEREMKLVGLVQEIKNSDQLFFLAFGRLGLICPGIETNEDFITSFNCSKFEN